MSILNMPRQKSVIFAQRTMNTLRTAEIRHAETPEQCEQLLESQRIHNATKRASESFAKYKEKLKQQRVYEAAKRANETVEQYERRLQQQRAYESAKRASETPEQYRQRLERQRIREATRRSKETPEQRERRIKHQRAYETAKRITKNPEERRRLQELILHFPHFNQGSLRKRKSDLHDLKTIATMSSESDAFLQPTVPQLEEKHVLQNQFQERQTFTTQSTQLAVQPVSSHVQSLSPPAQVTAPPLQDSSQMQFEQRQPVEPALYRTPTLAASENTRVLKNPIPIDVTTPDPIQKPQSWQKPKFVVQNHHLSVMSNLTALWQKRKLCDAGIGNGTSTVMVHKVVLSAVCPKLLSVFSTDVLSQKFLQVNFPEEVSTEALNAFAEYMYNGSLDLDIEILKQLKIIAKRLDMKEFMQLCDSHLSNVYHQSPVPPLTKLPLIETTMSFPTMSSSHDPSIFMDASPPVTTEIIDINHEISDAELDQVKKDTDALFNQESKLASLTSNKSTNPADCIIYPGIKAEPARPDENKYGYLNSSFTSSTTSLSLSSPSIAMAVSTSIPTSSTEFFIPFSQSTDFKSTRLKPIDSYETPLVSDLSLAPCIDEPVCSQSSSMNEDSSKQLNRQSIPTSSLQFPPTLTNNEGIYPVGLFTIKGNNTPLLTAETFDLKSDLT